MISFTRPDVLLVPVSVAPPSLPVCLWEGDTEAGGSVTLSCAVAEGVPTPEMRWEKLEPEQISLPLNMESKNSGTTVP